MLLCINYLSYWLLEKLGLVMECFISFFGFTLFLFANTRLPIIVPLSFGVRFLFILEAKCLSCDLFCLHFCAKQIKGKLECITHDCKNKTTKKTTMFFL